MASRWFGRKTKLIALSVAMLAVLGSVPILRIETRCLAPTAPVDAASTSALAPEERRDAVNTYLTYPEWSIVHAYEDLAAVTRRGSESDFDYFRSINDYWRNLCYIARLSSSRGAISGEYKTMLYVIGVSFAAEMGVKGAYEQSIGRVTARIRGDKRTPEDEFALKLADDYAAFLRQVPWYEFPFGTRLAQFWSETSLTGGNPIRKIERRLALTLEWGVKSIYAQAIGFAAGVTMPAKLRVWSVVADLEQSDIDADRRITLVRKTGAGDSVIETDRYRTLTEIIEGLASRGRSFAEIAGNRQILVTVHAPAGAPTQLPGTQPVLVVPIGAKPGWNRIALDVEVRELTNLLRRLKATPYVLEHIYDY